MVLRLRNISCETADFILSAGGLALMDLATQAAVAHSYVLRHCDYVCKVSIAIVKGEVEEMVFRHDSFAVE